MTRSPRSAFENNPLRKRLAALRRRLRLVATARGAGWIVGLLLLSAAAVGALDWVTKGLPAAVRAFALVAILGSAAVIGFIHLFRPLAEHMDDLALALRIEERYPSLNDALASTVQFLELAEHKAVTGEAASAAKDSPAMRREAARRALQKAEGCDFFRVVDTRGLRSAGALGILGCLAALTLFFLFPTEARTALERLTNPFGGPSWPRATTLELDAYKNPVGDNELFEVNALVRGTIPKYAVVAFKLANGSLTEHRCDVDVQDGAGRIRTTLKLTPGHDSFQFQVSANDAITRWHDVEVRSAPKLSSRTGDSRLSMQLRLVPPAYTGLPAKLLPEGVGTLDVPFGTVVELEARANVPLGAAWIEFQPENRDQAVAAVLAPLASSDFLSFLCSDACAHGLGGRLEATLADDGESFRVVFMPRLAGRYAIQVQDKHGMRGRQEFPLKLRFDPAPKVLLERPHRDLDGIDPREGILALPTATLPARVLVEDPIYGLRAVWLEYRTQPDQPFRRQLLVHPGITGRDMLLAPLSWPGLGILTAKIKPISHTLERPWRLGDLRHPDGTPLQAGDTITLRAASDDYDDVTAGKEPGYSAPVEIHLVTREALEKALNSEQAQIQRDLKDVEDKQRAIVRQTRQLEAALNERKTLTPDDLNQLLKIQEQQLQVRDALISKDPASVRQRIQRLQETLKQNELTRSAAEKRMNDLKRELQTLEDDELKRAQDALAATLQQGRLNPDKRRLGEEDRLKEAAIEAEREAEKLHLQAEQEKTPPRRALLEQTERKLRDDAARLREMAEQAKQDRQTPSPQADARAMERGKEMLRLAKREEDLARALEKSDRTGQDSDTAQAARELRNLAEQFRNLTPPESRVGDVQERQTAVQATLKEMLRQLEPWSSTREVKSDVRDILEEQRKLLSDVEELENRKFPAEREKLQLEERRRLQEKLDNATAGQKDVRERLRQLEDKMQRLSEDRKESDPGVAQEMQDALRELRNSDAAGKMEQAQDQLKQGQTGRASKQQAAAVEALEKLARQMDDRREAELDRLNKNMKEQLRKLEELAQKQDLLRKKIKEAEKIEDEKKRKEELKRLTKEQQELQQQTEEAAKQLSRLRAEGAAAAARQAAQEMEQAVKRLERGEPADRQQDEALERLDDAAEAIEKAADAVEEELAREQLARVADRLKPLKERQDRLLADTRQLESAVLAAKGWDIDRIEKLTNLVDNQRLLGEEAQALSDRELAGAPIFARQLTKAAEAMKLAATELEKRLRIVRGKRGDVMALAEALRHQEDAQRRLQSLLDALKVDEQGPGRPGRGANRGQDGEPRRVGDGIPPLAQLKLLRAMQAEINEKTQEFAKKHPDRAKLTEDEKKELQKLELEQRLIADLVEEYTDRPAKDGGEKP